MQCSLNEIEILAQKATRGAGLPWGLAEEAGKAVRWLESHGLPGIRVLAADLPDLAVPDWQDGFPILDHDTWRARDGILDGLLCGVTLGDRMGSFVTRDFADFQLRLIRVRRPLLLLPFVVPSFRFAEFGLQFHIAPQNLAPAVSGKDASSQWAKVAEVKITDEIFLRPLFSSIFRKTLEQVDGGIAVNDHTYAVLQKWAHKTYVPESAESQARGAGGADLIETD